MDFKIEDYDIAEDEMAGYTKVKIETIIGKSFVVEKVTIQKDKNCTEKNPFSMNMAIDLDGDKLFIYTTSNRLINTAKNVLAEFGEFPQFPIRIETEKYLNSPNAGYKFVSE